VSGVSECFLRLAFDEYIHFIPYLMISLSSLGSSEANEWSTSYGTKKT
jgi:hypothetical protein